MRDLIGSHFLRATMLGLVTVPASLVLSSAPIQGQVVQNIGGERWLEIERVYGDVTLNNGSYRDAKVGDRLSQIGDGLMTARRSSSILAIDSAIGRLQMSENTHLSVDQLELQADGARVTLLEITRGQARMQTRRFSNPNSRLEIRTPSGVAAVRGTDFGVSIHPDGTMAIATESGAVEVSALANPAAPRQNTSVMLYPGYMSTIVPGQAPSAPHLLDRQLGIDVLRQDYVGGRLKLKAKVDPANSVLFNGEEVVTDKEGLMTTSVALHHSVLEVVVRNPMGETREHFIWINDD